MDTKLRYNYCTILRWFVFRSRDEALSSRFRRCTPVKCCHDFGVKMKLVSEENNLVDDIYFQQFPNDYFAREGYKSTQIYKFLRKFLHFMDLSDKKYLIKDFITDDFPGLDICYHGSSRPLNYYMF